VSDAVISAVNDAEGVAKVVDHGMPPDVAADRAWAWAWAAAVDVGVEIVLIR